MQREEGIWIAVRLTGNGDNRVRYIFAIRSSRNIGRVYFTRKVYSISWLFIISTTTVRTHFGHATTLTTVTNKIAKSSTRGLSNIVTFYDSRIRAVNYLKIERFIRVTSLLSVEKKKKETFITINSLRNWFEYPADDLFIISLWRTIIGKNLQNGSKKKLFDWENLMLFFYGFLNNARFTSKYCKICCKRMFRSFFDHVFFQTICHSFFFSSLVNRNRRRNG